MRSTSRTFFVVLACAAVAVTAAVFAERTGVLSWPRERSTLLAPVATVTPAAAKSRSHECLPTGNGFFRARLDGALEKRIDWSNAGTQCDGMPRPDGNGIRLSFHRTTGPDSNLLIVLGIAGLSESSSGRALPVNVTIIEEGSSRVFGTLGDDRCTIDELRQDLLTPWRPDTRSYRVTGRGFCTQPASAVSGSDTVLMSTFDFAGIVTFETEHPPPSAERST